jgi:alpha-D-ribose 1-methylphosphonate 5-triphosphate synthase subunit PhnG
MGAAARNFVRGERTLDHAAARLRETLDSVVRAPVHGRS